MANRAGIALFERYSISELAEKTPYSEATLLAIKNGYRKPSEIFRMKVSRALGVPEDQLFSPVATEAA